MAVKVIEDNILKFKRGAIIHQTNCLGVMNKGVAKSLRIAYPRIYREYSTLVNVTNNKAELLGQVQVIQVSDDLYVVNAFGQFTYGKKNACLTRYDALRKALRQINTWAKVKGIKTVALPYGIGCGLAGGDWKIVEGIIRDELIGVEVELYKI